MINVNQSLGRVIRNKNDYGVMICIDKRYISIKNLFSNWMTKNLEIKSLKENDNYFKELNDFYSHCKSKYSKKNLNLDFKDNILFNNNINNNIINNNIYEDDIDNDLTFNLFAEDINNNINNNIHIDDIKNNINNSLYEDNKNSHIFNKIELLKKRKREEKDFEDNLSISNKNNNEEEDEQSESIDNNLIDKELIETINKDSKFDNKQFQKLQNNMDVISLEKISRCPICFTGINQSLFLSYSISKCNHILCNICWNKIISSTKECPLCKRKVVLSDLKKIILNKWIDNK